MKEHVSLRARTTAGKGDGGLQLLNGVSRLLILASWLVGSVSSALAQTMQVSAPVDEDGFFVQAVNTPWNEEFSVSVVINTGGHDISGAQFSITNLKDMYPALLLTGVEYPSGLATNSADGLAGEFDLTVAGCVPACAALEVVRVSFFDPGGMVGFDVIMQVTGLGASDVDTGPTITDCEGHPIEAPLGGPDGAAESCGPAPWPAGSLLLNGLCYGRAFTPIAPTPYADCDPAVEAGRGTLGRFKSRYGSRLR